MNSKKASLSLQKKEKEFSFIITKYCKYKTKIILEDTEIIVLFIIRCVPNIVNS